MLLVVVQGKLLGVVEQAGVPKCPRRSHGVAHVDVPVNTTHQRCRQCCRLGLANCHCPPRPNTGHFYLKKQAQVYFQENFIMKETLPLFPLLLNSENPQDDLTYKTVPVRAYQILDILKGNTKHLSFPFTINIYTSYHFVKETSLEIDRNMIGQLLREDTSDVLYVFLTPDIEKICVKINALNTIKNSIKFDKHNLFANTKITEGDKKVFYKTPNENILNQNSCICDHEDTHTFSPPKRYQHLGIQKNLFLFIKLVITNVYNFQ